MADDINVPIKLPTDSSSVSAAKSAVDGLAAGLKGLGPAAAAGASKAKSELNGLTEAAQSAARETAKYGRDSKGRFLAGPKRGEAPPTAEGGVDVSLKTFVAQEKKRAQIARSLRKEMVSRDKEALKQAQDAAAARAANIKEINSAALGAAGLVAALGAVVAGVSARFVSALVSVQAFREATLGAFRSLLGSAGAADKAFKDTIKTADQVGISYEDALRGVNSLIAKGFKADEAQNLVKAMADLKAVVPDANIKNLLLAVTQIKSKGVLQMEELQGQIAEAGLSVSVVLEEIGKSIGKSAQEVRAMIKKGQISADQGVAGIMAAIQKTTGKPIGKAAEEASKSLGGLLSRLEQIPQGLLLMADASKGVSGLKEVLSNVLRAFAPSTEGGKALSAAIGRLGDAFATFLGGLRGEGGAKLLQEFAGSLALGAERAADLVTKIGLLTGPALSEFLKGFSQASKLLGGKEAQSGAEGYAALGEALGKVGRALGVIAALASTLDVVFGAAGHLFELAGAVGDAGAALSGLWASITGWISGASAAIGGAAQSIGSNLVQGIITGISLAAPGLGIAIQGLAAMATGTMAAAHRIKSPSREWRDDIGYQLPAGAAEGVYDGAPLMARAARDVAGGTTGAGRTGTGGLSKGGGAVYQFGERSIVVYVTGGPSAGRDFVAQLTTELEAVS